MLAFTSYWQKGSQVTSRGIKLDIDMDLADKMTTSPAAKRTVDLRFVELADKMRKNRPGDDFALLRRGHGCNRLSGSRQTLSGELAARKIVADQLDDLFGPPGKC